MFSILFPETWLKLHNLPLAFYIQVGNLRMEMGLSESLGGQEPALQEIFAFGNIAKNMLECCFQEHRAA